MTCTIFLEHIAQAQSPGRYSHVLPSGLLRAHCGAAETPAGRSDGQGRKAVHFGAQIIPSTPWIWKGCCCIPFQCTCIVRWVVMSEVCRCDDVGILCVCVNRRYKQGRERHDEKDTYYKSDSFTELHVHAVTSLVRCQPTTLSAYVPHPSCTPRPDRHSASPWTHRPY